MLLIFSCTKLQTPEEVLKKFIELRFNSQTKFESILALLDGDLRADYLNSKSELTEVLKKKLYFKSLKIRSVDSDGEKASIVYTLVYFDDDSKNNLITVKKIAQFMLFAKEWKIIDIHNIKTNISILEKLDIHGSK